MNEEQKEIMLDLLCKQATQGLDERETKQLEQLEYSSTELESIELTVAALGLIDLDTKDEMPPHLRSKILAGAEDFFAARNNVTSDTGNIAAAPLREIVWTESTTPSPWFAWLGWAAAAAACIALAVNIFSPKTQTDLVGKPPTPTPLRNGNSVRLKNGRNWSILPDKS